MSESAEEKDPRDALIEQILVELKDEDKAAQHERDRPESTLVDLPLDWRGHYAGWEDPALWNEKDPKERLRSILARSSMFLHFINHPKEYEALKRGERLDTPIQLTRNRFAVECPQCEEEVHLFCDGTQVWAEPSCPHPDGLPTTEFELNVPSGALVVANDLRDLFPVADDYDINKRIGCHQTTLAYARNGLAHGFVGNSCPGMYTWKGHKNSYLLGTQGSSDTWDEKKKKWVRIPPPPFEGGKRVAGICTDLWWYSICDRREFERRCTWRGIDSQKALKDFGCDVVYVKPGVYRFRHNNIRREYDGQPEYYTFIERVRTPDPETDFIAQHLAQTISVQQALYASFQRYPTLYAPKVGHFFGRIKSWEECNEEERAHSLARIADHYLMTIGNGVDWDERGFPLMIPVEPTPDFPIPRFPFQQHWYPGSLGYSRISRAAGYKSPYSCEEGTPSLAPDFARLVFSVLESIIRYGQEPHMRKDDWAEAVEAARKDMREAAACYYKLKERYPDCSYPDFDAWMMDPEAVETHIASFPFPDAPVPRTEWDIVPAESPEDEEPLARALREADELIASMEE